MKLWLKILLGIYVLVWAISLVGCTEANIPKGTIRANGIPSSLSLRVIPDTCVSEDVNSGNGIVSILATVKDELGNPGSGSVIFVSTSQAAAPTSVPLVNGVAQGNFTLNCSTSALFPATLCTDPGNCVFQISAIIADLTSTVNVTLINSKLP
jgi:hypothetical protein